MTPAATRRRRFREDIQAIADYYLEKEGLGLATRFIDSLESLVNRIARNPGIGAQCEAELGLAGLRSHAMPDFPFVIFYIHTQESVTFVRVLHGRRDIPSIL